MEETGRRQRHPLLQQPEQLPAGLPAPQRDGQAGYPVMRNRRGASWSLESATLHLSEQDRLALVLCLSHQQTAELHTTDMLAALRVLGTDSCGTEMTADGHPVWALVPLWVAAPGTGGRTA
ncbi:hypothetical protein [Streptomyces sp. SGAir0957]